MTCYEIHTLASKQFDNFLALVWTSFKDFQAVEPGLPGGNAQVLECEDFWDISMLLIRHRQQQQQDAELGHIAKNRQKRDSKNSWNRRTILVPATVWQILNVKLRQPETKVIWIWRNFHLVKSPWANLCFGGFSTFGTTVGCEEGEEALLIDQLRNLLKLLRLLLWDWTQRVWTRRKLTSRKNQSFHRYSRISSNPTNLLPSI